MRDSFSRPRRLIAVLSVIAVSLSLTGKSIAEAIPDSFWLTEDGSLALAVGACEAGSAVSCGIIAGVPGAARDADLARHRSDLCQLPVIWDLKWNAAEKRWTGGQILDPETGKTHKLHVVAKGSDLELHVFEDGNKGRYTLILKPVEAFEDPCE